MGLFLTVYWVVWIQAVVIWTNLSKWCLATSPPSVIICLALRSVKGGQMRAWVRRGCFSLVILKVIIGVLSYLQKLCCYTDCQTSSMLLLGRFVYVWHLEYAYFKLYASRRIAPSLSSMTSNVIGSLSSAHYSRFMYWKIDFCFLWYCVNLRICHISVFSGIRILLVPVFDSQNREWN